MTEFISTNSLNNKQKKEIVDLWNNEYPTKLKHKSLEAFEVYLSPLKNQNHILIVDKFDIVKGWCMDFERTNEKWFAMILDSTLQGKGLGTKLLNKAKETNPELNGWVIDHNKDIKQNGEYYISPIEFYTKNGFKINTETRLELNTISAIKIKWNK